MKNIALFSNDAGASEILLELAIVNLDIYNFKIFCLIDSPCFTKVKEKNLQTQTLTISNSKREIFKALDIFKPNIIIYGTGWQNHLEYFFVEYAKEHKLVSIAFLDHWTNYLQRFGFPESNWRDNLPDFIATHDDMSETVAKKLNLPNVIAIKNYSLISMLKQKSTTKESSSLLFLTEPTAKVAKSSFKDENYWGFDEIDVFKNIYKYRDKFECKDIVVRLHPSDTQKKYKSINSNLNISDKSLMEDINRAKIVIGIDTIALRIAYLLGKKVIAYIPSKRRDFVVPLPKTNQLRDLSSLNIRELEINSKPIDEFGMEFAVFIEKLEL